MCAALNSTISRRGRGLRLVVLPLITEASVVLWVQMAVLAGTGEETKATRGHVSSPNVILRPVIWVCVRSFRLLWSAECWTRTRKASSNQRTDTQLRKQRAKENHKWNAIYRSTQVIKTIGAGIVGSVVLTGSASADGRQLPREAPDGRTVYATWGDDEIWEIFDAEPPSRWQDSEGDDNAHEPLYFIKVVPGAAHSPHFPGAGIDHTVPVPGGTDKQYSAQWHPKAVVDPDNPGLQNLVNQDQDGTT